MRTIVAAALLAAAVLPPVSARADVPVLRTVERSIEATPRVRVDNLTGDVRIAGDDGATVRVTARVRAASDADAAAVGIELTRANDEVHVSTTVPHRSPGIWQIFDRRRISVDLVVTVPRATAVVARTATGDVDIRGLTQPIDAHVSTGDLRLHDVAGDATASVGTGDVGVDLVAGWTGFRITARTRTGDVHIIVPSGLRAHVTAHTRVGDVRNRLGNADVASPIIEATSSVGDVTISTR